VRLAEGQLIVAVPNTFAKEYIESRFSVLLEEAITGRLGEAASLELVVGERLDEAAGRLA
jgi:chromosomal replication initiation ATPase DnaA